MDSAHQSDPERRTLAQKLEYLFRTVREPGRREYTNEEVATAITRDQGVTISASYVWYLRTGQRDNPTLKHISALATFFGVSPGYFFDDTARQEIESELALLAALRDTGVRDIALRSAGLSTESVRTMQDVLARVRQLEGLPPHDHEPDTS